MHPRFAVECNAVEKYRPHPCGIFLASATSGQIFEENEFTDIQVIMKKPCSRGKLYSQNGGGVGSDVSDGHMRPGSGFALAPRSSGIVRGHHTQPL